MDEKGSPVDVLREQEREKTAARQELVAWLGPELQRLLDYLYANEAALIPKAYGGAEWLLAQIENLEHYQGQLEQMNRYALESLKADVDHLRELLSGMMEEQG